MLLRLIQLFSLFLGSLGIVANASADAFHLMLPTKPKSELAYPGSIDVGLGWAVIPSANSLNQSASGLIVTIKAYPLGRWYAPLKPKAPQDAAKQILSAIQTQATVSVSAAAAGSPAPSGEFDQQVVQGVTDALTKLNTTELYQIEESNAINRISIFYGRSPGNFDNQVVKSNVNVIGFQFDITPDISAMAGYAFYQNLLPNNTFESKNRWMFGIQMNANAYSAFRNIGNTASGQ